MDKLINFMNELEFVRTEDENNFTLHIEGFDIFMKDGVLSISDGGEYIEKYDDDPDGGSPELYALARAHWKTIRMQEINNRMMQYKMPEGKMFK